MISRCFLVSQFIYLSFYANFKNISSSTCEKCLYLFGYGRVMCFHVFSLCKENKACLYFLHIRKISNIETKQKQYLRKHISHTNINKSISCFCGKQQHPHLNKILLLKRKENNIFSSMFSI